MTKIALQLYSVRELAAKDLLGTIRRIADFGYEAVQFAGFFGTPAEQLKAVLDEKKLSVAGAHVPIEQLMKQPLEDIITYNKTIGNDLIICPYLPEHMRKTKADVDQVVQCFNDFGKAFAAAGMTFAYHNHDFEFHPFEGSTVFDMIFENTDPELVKIELDCYWAVVSGKDPKTIIEKYRNRILSLHIKDGKEVDGKFVNTVIGEGIIDYEGIVEVAKKYALNWLTVEQEQFSLDIMESIRLNVDRLKAIRASNQNYRPQDK
jgi:sugar phosphate isomerase/epimerase